MNFNFLIRQKESEVKTLQTEMQDLQEKLSLCITQLNSLKVVSQMNPVLDSTTPEELIVLKNRIKSYAQFRLHDSKVKTTMIALDDNNIRQISGLINAWTSHDRDEFLQMCYEYRIVTDAVSNKEMSKHMIKSLNRMLENSTITKIKYDWFMNRL